MNQELPRSTFVERTFWVAAGLAVIGAVAPLLVTLGHANRLSSVFFPFAAAAIGLGALALFYQYGKAMAALIYFLAGLAIAYGMLLMLSVPMRLAVLGSCPRPPQVCTGNLDLELSGAESTALTLGVAFGVMALFAGFIALAALYRSQAPAPAQMPSVWPDRPPPKPEPEPEPEPEPVAKVEPEPEPAAVAVAAEQMESEEPAAVAPPPRKPRRKRKPRPPAEPSSEPPPLNG